MNKKIRKIWYVNDGDNYEEDKEGKEDRTCLGQRLCNCNFKYDAMEGLIKKMTLLQKYKEEGNQSWSYPGVCPEEGNSGCSLKIKFTPSLSFLPLCLHLFLHFKKKKKI